MKCLEAAVALCFLVQLGVGGSARLLEPRCLTTRVIEGLYNTAPWMARISGGRGYICQGTLITSRYVLTAAHCVSNQNRFSVKLGLRNGVFSSSQYAVRDKETHFQFSMYNYTNDIALLRLQEDVIFNDFVRPACISLDMDLLQEVKQLSEFEAFRGHLAHDQGLNQMVLSRSNPSECGVGLGFYPNDKQICVNQNNGDICTDDTGGPLVRRITYEREYGFLLLGITSIVKDSCQGNMIITNVMSYVDWIDHHINPSSGETESEEQDNNTSPPSPKSTTTEAPQEQPQFLNSDCGEYTSGIHPWSIHIYGNGFMAKGTVITDRFIVTNAHNMPNEPNSLEVDMVDSTGSYEFYVDLVLKHPEYRDGYQNDIALLRLTKPLSSTVKPICLITNPANNKKLVRLNYSLIINENKNALIKEVRRLTSYECAEKLSKRIDENQFCVTIPAGTEHGSPGDIIGLDLNDDGEHKYTITGIASYSKNGIKVITDVVKHSEWILQEVQKHQV